MIHLRQPDSAGVAQQHRILLEPALNTHIRTETERQSLYVTKFPQNQKTEMCSQQFPEGNDGDTAWDTRVPIIVSEFKSFSSP